MQTVTFSIGCDISDVSRRNEFTSSFGFPTNGNFIRQDLLLQPNGGAATLSLPSQAIYVMTAGTDVVLQVTWTDNSVETSRTFKINKMLFLADVTNITNLQVINNEAIGTPPESVRVLLF
jgi:hypothetical protein